MLTCSGCRRHVRALEAECPFCRVALPRTVARAPQPGRARLSRSALVAAFATTAVACGSTVSSPDAGNDAAPEPEDGGIDGFAPVDAGVKDAPSPTDAFIAPDALCCPLYGAAPGH